MRPILDFLRDLRSAGRALRRSPGFTGVAVFTLALGIGATTAIFSVVKAILLEPLPFPDPTRLVFVWSDMTSAGYPRGPLSGPELADLRTRTTRFDGFAAIWATTATITGDGEPEMLRIGLMTPDFLPLLGVAPALGRLPTEDREAAILLSAALWRRRFGADPGIVGQRIVVDGEPATVVGVMPAGFRASLPLDAGVPDDLEAWRLFDRNIVNGERGRMYLRVVGRLRPGVTFEAARQEVGDLAARLSREFADYGRAGRRFALVGLQAEAARPLEGTLLALFGGVAILLLTAVVNVAGLLVARAAARANETALRLALGAGRGRLFSQCLADGAVIATLGGLAGVVTAVAGVQVLRAWRPASLARIDDANLDLGVLAATGGIALGVAVCFSLAPLTEVFRSRMATALRAGSRGAGGAISHRVRSSLVVAQLALAVVLVVSAALFARSFQAIQSVDPGFRPDGVLSFRIALAPDRFYDQAAFNQFSRQWQARLAAMPGVLRVGAISHLPFDNVPNWSTTWLLDPGIDDSEARRADARAVTPGFFSAVGAELTAGRDFAESDDPTGPPVVIVDERFARRAWPNARAVGQSVAVDPFVTGHATIRVTVVGVVRHIRHLDLLGEVREQVYFPARQVPRNPLGYVVRMAGGTTGFAGQLRAALDELDPQVPIVDLRPLGDAVVEARATPWFTLRLVTLFAVVALGMGAVGVYGVMAYSVARRRAEIGVRLALGARPTSVVAMVVREGGLLAGLGLALGAGVALGVTALIRHQLHGVTSTDVTSYLIAVPVLGMAAGLASWLPARRAARVSPLEALRSE